MIMIKAESSHRLKNYLGTLELFFVLKEVAERESNKVRCNTTVWLNIHQITSILT